MEPLHKSEIVRNEFLITSVQVLTFDGARAHIFISKCAVLPAGELVCTSNRPEHGISRTHTDLHGISSCLQTDEAQ
jgi:hypothetical protein